MKQKKDKEQKERDFERLVQEQRQTIYSVCYLFADEEACPAASRLHKRIARLHPFDRALILLWLEDLPYDEIAAILGISVSNVSVRRVRIREKLKSFTD